jgi:hypothetical protein
MKETLKIQILFVGHLRGTTHLNDFKKFFKSFDIELINKELNSNYKNLQLDYYLYTYPEIQFKQKILEFGKIKYPQLYKEYTVDDFYKWLDEYKNTFEFKKVIIDSDVRKETDDIYQKYINESNAESDRVYIDLYEHERYHCGYQFLKHEKMSSMIDQTADLVFKIRPDLIFNFDYNKEDTINLINKNIVTILKDKSKSVYLHFYHSGCGGLQRAGDYYHLGSPENMNLLFNNIALNNLNIHKEFTFLDKNKFPIIWNYLEPFITCCHLEVRHLLNSTLNKIDIKTIWFPHVLLYIYVPYEKNYTCEINYHTIHDLPF